MSENERLKELQKKLNFPNQEKFAEALGIKQGSLSDIYRSKKGIGVSESIKRILEKEYSINIEWLETGNGEITKGSLNCDVLIDDEKNDVMLVPLYNLDARAGMNGGNNVDISEGEYIVRYIPFEGARKEDRCFPIYGDSMITAYPSGSIVLTREVYRWRDYFGYGNVFYIFLKDGRRILKQILKHDDSKNYIVCHSFNPNYGDEDLPKDMIHSVWKVIKGLTEPGW